MSQKIEGLILQLDTAGDRVAEAVIARLVKLGSSAVPLLIKAACNGDEPRIRKWSLLALGSIGDRRAAPVLMESLGEERMNLRLNAVRGLARMKYKPAAAKIAKLLRDESGGIRVNALYALQTLGARQFASQVQKCLKDPQWYVRQEACVACGAFRTSRARGELSKLAVGDQRKAVRVAAAAALKKLS
jgi:HEAT repeat protein